MRKLKIVIICLMAVVAFCAARTKPQEAAAIPSPRVIRLGQASWYSEQDPGINYRTANNEIFNDDSLTCAMWGVSFNQEIRVTNLANGKSIIVRVNDRGPHKRFVRNGRIIDLTKNAFKKIADNKQGLIDVQLELL